MAPTRMPTVMLMAAQMMASRRLVRAEEMMPKRMELPIVPVPRIHLMLGPK